MTDKELLEAAARAAGYPIPNPVGRYPTSGFKEGGTFYWRSGDDYREERTWNPLTDDGDAFRLAVDLGIFDSFEFKYQSADLLWGNYPSHRRLIVELAAKGFRV